MKKSQYFTILAWLATIALNTTPNVYLGAFYAGCSIAFAIAMLIFIKE